MFLTPQQRIQLLTDLNSFEPFGASVRSRSTGDWQQDGDGVECGSAKIGGRDVVVAIQDSSFKGMMGKAHSDKITAAVTAAVKMKVPFIAVFNSGGARIQEGIMALHPAANLATAMARASGVIPTIAVITGTNSGATAYISALMDFIIMTSGASMFLTGPRVIEKVTGEKTGMQELGGTAVHGKITGLASFVVDGEAEAFAALKSLLQYLPQHYLAIENNADKKLLSEAASSDKLDHLTQHPGYDMKTVIREIADENSFLEVQEFFAENLVTGFAKLCGLKIGIVANQPQYMSGVLDANCSKKMFRFLQQCDAYSIPLLFLTDTPGFLPGTDEEHEDIVGMGSRILHVLANSTVPKINLVTGKWIGGAYAGMCSKAMGADYVYVWYKAQVGVLGTEPALALIYANAIREKNNDPAFIQQLREEYAEKVLDPFIAAQTGLVDGVINPQETRPLLAKLFYSLQNKTQKTVQRKRPIIPM